MVRPAFDAAAMLKEEGISAGLLDMYCVKPLDKEGLVEAAKKVKVVISIEEHAPFGGLGSMVSQVSVRSARAKSFLCLCRMRR